MVLLVSERDQSAELRDAFLRYLPQRLKTLLRRTRAQNRDGWDINVLRLLHDEVANLAGACGRYGQLELGERLLALESTLGPYAQAQQLPDVGITDQVNVLLDSLRPHLEDHIPALPAMPLPDSVTGHTHASEDGGYPSHETPPAN